MFYYKNSSKDFYLVDMAKCSIAESKNILDEADLVIAFFSQGNTEIQNFFERFSSLIPKALFVIVDYQRDFGLTCRKICTEYGIKRNKILIIPYDAEFEKACEEGNLQSFVLENMHQTVEEEKNNCIANLKKLSKKIYMFGMHMKKEEREDE